MNKMIIARCGNRCDLCPAYLGNLSKNKNSEEISKGWLKFHGFHMPPEEIGCVGCLNEGKQNREGCEIRKCCNKKVFENCGHCKKAICKLLQRDIDVVEGSLKQNKNISSKEFRLFFEPYQVKKTILEIKRRLKSD